MRLPVAVSLLFSLGDSSYLASGMFPDKRFYIFDSAGKEKSRFGDYPNFWSRENDLPIEVKCMFHQVRGYGFSIKNGFALADSHVLSIASLRAAAGKIAGTCREYSRSGCDCPGGRDEQCRPFISNGWAVD